MERQSMFMAGRLNIVKMAIFPTSIFKFNSISIKISAGLSAEIDKLIQSLNSYRNESDSEYLKYSWKRRKTWEFHTCQFKNLLQNCNNQETAVLS